MCFLTFHRGFYMLLQNKTEYIIIGPSSRSGSGLCIIVPSLLNLNIWRNGREIVVSVPVVASDGATATSEGSAPGGGLGSGFSARSRLWLVGSAKRLQVVLHWYSHVNPDSLMGRFIALYFNHLKVGYVIKVSAFSVADEERMGYLSYLLEMLVWPL